MGVESGGGGGGGGEGVHPPQILMGGGVYNRPCHIIPPPPLHRSVWHTLSFAALLLHVYLTRQIYVVLCVPQV